MTRYRREAMLLEPVSLYFRRRGFRQQKAELRFYENSIDFYAVSPSTRATVAVELKLHKWRRAFEQALLYQLCADEVYVALPSGMCRRVDASLLQEHGVGLVCVSESGRCRFLLRPGQPCVMRPHYKEYYVRMLLGEANGPR